MMHHMTVTVFNLYRSKQLGTATWYPHVISGCYFNADKAANVEKTGLENADAAKLHVPYLIKDGKILVRGKDADSFLEYLDPIAWDTQTNDLYPQTITFTEGEDFFLFGEYPEEPIEDSTYREGLETYLNSTRDNVFKITSCGKYTVIPHFEIGGA